MRIRSIKPEFWRSDDVASLPWSIVYDGPIPPRPAEIAPMDSSREYVYMLFDVEDALLYVGRSFRPADRFSRHRRKAWWTQVAGVVILQVAETSGSHWTYRAGVNTARLEALAICELTPRHNVVIPIRKVAR